jgi:hypothetical protein
MRRAPRRRLIGLSPRTGCSRRAIHQLVGRATGRHRAGPRAGQTSAAAARVASDLHSPRKFCAPAPGPLTMLLAGCASQLQPPRATSLSRFWGHSCRQSKLLSVTRSVGHAVRRRAMRGRAAPPESPAQPTTPNPRQPTPRHSRGSTCVCPSPAVPREGQTAAGCAALESAGHPALRAGPPACQRASARLLRGAAGACARHTACHPHTPAASCVPCCQRHPPHPGPAQPRLGPLLPGRRGPPSPSPRSNCAPGRSPAGCTGRLRISPEALPARSCTTPAEASAPEDARCAPAAVLAGISSAAGAYLPPQVPGSWPAARRALAAPSRARGCYAAPRPTRGPPHLTIRCHELPAQPLPARGASLAAAAAVSTAAALPAASVRPVPAGIRSAPSTTRPEFALRAARRPARRLQPALLPSAAAAVCACSRVALPGSACGRVRALTATPAGSGGLHSSANTLASLTPAASGVGGRSGVAGGLHGARSMPARGGTARPARQLKRLCTCRAAVPGSAVPQAASCPI